MGAGVRHERPRAQVLPPPLIPGRPERRSSISGRAGRNIAAGLAF
jgi:hypothetical protein